MAAFFEPYLQKSCDLVMDSVTKSCLNFFLQKTAYSLYLSIRKSLVRNKPSEEADENEPKATNFNNEDESLLKEEIRTLNMKLAEAEDKKLEVEI